MCRPTSSLRTPSAIPNTSKLALEGKCRPTRAIYRNKIDSLSERPRMSGRSTCPKGGNAYQPGVLILGTPSNHSRALKERRISAIRHPSPKNPNFCCGEIATLEHKNRRSPQWERRSSLLGKHIDERLPNDLRNRQLAYHSNSTPA